MIIAPRIYYLYAELLTTDEALSRQLDACGRMGFTHVLAPLPAPDSADADSGIARLSAAARTAGLKLLLDVAIPAPHQSQQSNDPDAPPDPRRLGRALTIAAAGQEGDAPTDWPAQLTRWASAGADGFNCRGLALHASDFWRDLIAGVRAARPDALMIAWTPGCSPAQLAPLAGVGFDATVASTAWWDGRAGWLAEESARLTRIAPPIGLVDDPHAPMAAGLRGDEDADAARRRCERLLGVAAACGAGLLMPMGFESGDSGRRALPGIGAAGQGAEQPAAQAGLFDQSQAIGAANALVQTLSARESGATAIIAAAGKTTSGATLLLRGVNAAAAASAATAAPTTDAYLIVVNPDSQHPSSADLSFAVRRLGGLQVQASIWPPELNPPAQTVGDDATAPVIATTPAPAPAPAPMSGSTALHGWPGDAADASTDALDDTQLILPPGGMQVLAVRPQPPVVHFVNRGKRSADAACRAPRVAIERITPGVDGGRFPVKRSVGEQVAVEADVFMDGHDKLGVMLLWRPADLAGWQEVRMSALGNDRWRAHLPLRRVGRHVFVIQAWRDAFATYRDELSKKSAAGLDVTLELEEGRRMIAAAAAHAAGTGLAPVAAVLDALAARLAPAPVPTAASKNSPAVKAASAPARKSRSKAAVASVPAPAPAADAAATGSDAASASDVPSETGVTDINEINQVTAVATQAVDAARQSRARLVAEVLSDDILRAMQAADARPFAVQSEPVHAIDAERLAAGFSSWYELFPRSQSGDPARHGNFADVEKRLPAIRDMGFDTLYFPPIHPIGRRNRKGRNNSLTPGPDDPGSPYAIGADEGGHTAIHPELGTLEDFRRLSKAARAHGLEIALDFAIQCSPDHPWIKAHPDWFAWRPDGSMRYAENPPKKYEDIVNVDFYADGAMPSLWIALRDAVLFWVNEGVRVFRVDNPHTKPLPFWEWMIGDIRARYPDVIFLSEAFTRPKVMYRLAKVGYSQSYSYFTWRHTKQEFIDYMTELSTTAVQDFFRPNFFVNTPDINPVFLQKSGRPGFLIRAALATLLSGLWGMYSGFELCEATPVPGKEDYLDSEKYEIRAWDWQRPGNIIAEITALNRIRRAHPALQSHLGVTFVDSSDPHMLCFLRHVRRSADATDLGDDVLFVAINLDPFAAHETGFTLPFWRLGIADHDALPVEDLIHGNRFTLQGPQHALRLDPGGLPYAVWRLAPHGENT